MNSLALLPLALAVSFPLCAQRVTGPSFGFSAQLNAPLGDLRDDTDKHLGAGASYLTQWDFHGCHALRPHLDLNFFPRDRTSRSNDREFRTLGAVGLGVDYL